VEQSFLARPYWRLCVAEWMERWRRALVEMQEVRDLCGPEVESVQDRYSDGAPLWNLHDLLTSEATDLSFRFVGAWELEVELTGKVLGARALRDANGGKWLAAIPGIERSASPAGRWIYAVSPEGVMTLRFSGQCPPPAGIKLRYPLEYVSAKVAPASGGEEEP